MGTLDGKGLRLHVNKSVNIQVLPESSPYVLILLSSIFLI